MPRIATGPRWYASRQSYFTVVNGKPHNLGPDLTEATRQYAKLTLRAPKLATDPTVNEIVVAYLTDRAATWKQNTRKLRQQMLDVFTAQFGESRVSELIPFHATTVQQENPGWGQGTVRVFRTSLMACFRWAARQGLIPESPFRTLEMPSPAVRGDSCLITEPQHQLMLAAASEAMQDVLHALWHTGNRPGYIRTVEAREVQGDRWVCGPMEGRKLPMATIYLDDFMQELSSRLLAQNPIGPIFRTERGRSWSTSAFNHGFKAVTGVAGLSHIIPYSYRHSFGRRALDRGVPISDLAVLMNTSVKQIEKTYGHAHTLTDRLRSAVRRVT